MLWHAPQGRHFQRAGSLFSLRSYTFGLNQRQSTICGFWPGSTPPVPIGARNLGKMAQRFQKARRSPNGENSVSRVYADANSNESREYWEYENLVVSWGCVSLSACKGCDGVTATEHMEDSASGTWLVDRVLLCLHSNVIASCVMSCPFALQPVHCWPKPAQVSTIIVYTCCRSHHALSSFCLHCGSL